MAVYWWDTDHVTRCRLPISHGPTLHWDGLRYFTTEGLQRPTEDAGYGYHMDRGRSAGVRRQNTTKEIP